MNIKPFKKIVEDTIAWIVSHTKKITDFNVGSVMRSIIEAVAVEIEEIYYSMWFGFRDAVKNAIFYAFDFHYKEPTYSNVLLTFTRVDTTDTTIPIYIPQGTVVSTPEGLYFSTDTDCTIEIGHTTAQVTATCQTAGIIGNVPENTITVVISADLQSSIRVTNENPASGGSDKETDEQIRLRFQEYIQSLAKGTLQALEYGAKSIAGVLGATAIDKYLGEVNLYVWDNNGELPPALQSAVETEIVNWRAGGIQVNVLAPTKTEVSVSLRVQVSDLDLINQSILENQISTAILNITNTISLGSSLNISEIISTAMNVSPLIVDVKVDNPDSDITADPYEILIINSVTITQITDTEI